MENESINPEKWVKWLVIIGITNSIISVIVTLVCETANAGTTGLVDAIITIFLLWWGYKIYKERLKRKSEFNEVLIGLLILLVIKVVAQAVMVGLRVPPLTKPLIIILATLYLLTLELF